MGGKISCAYDMFRVGSRIDDVVRHGFLVVYWSVYVSNSVLQYLCKIMKPYLCPQCAGFFLPTKIKLLSSAAALSSLGHTRKVYCGFIPRMSLRAPVLFRSAGVQFRSCHV